MILPPGRCFYSLMYLVAGLGLSLEPGTTGFAEEPVYQFIYPKLHKTAAERARVHQWIRLGSARFEDGILLPAYGITIEDPLNENPIDKNHINKRDLNNNLTQQGLLKNFSTCQPKACNFSFKLTATQAQQLAVYQVAGLGWFLAPRHWKTIEANMGPSGIAALVMLSPDRKQYLTMDNSSACVGCALSNASLFFPAAAGEARKNEFLGYEASNVALKKIPLNKQTVIYSYQLPAHYPSDGVAKFTGVQADIINFRKMTVSLTPEDKPLARRMLNFFIAIN